jgi:hypothetical protein
MKHHHQTQQKLEIKLNLQTLLLLSFLKKKNKIFRMNWIRFQMKYRNKIKLNKLKTKMKQ